MLQVFRCFTKVWSICPFITNASISRHISHISDSRKLFQLCLDMSNLLRHLVSLRRETGNLFISSPRHFQHRIGQHLKHNELLQHFLGPSVGTWGIKSLWDRVESCHARTPPWALWCSSGPFLPRWPDPLSGYHQSLKQRQPFAFVILCW